MAVSRFRDLRFQSKVLLSIIAVMVLLVAAIMFAVNRRITAQMQADGARALGTAEAVFRNSQQQIRANNLLLRFRNIANEPRFQSVVSTRHSKTVQHFLNSILADEAAGDVARYEWAEDIEPATARRAAGIDLDLFGRQSRAAVKQAFDGFANSDTIAVGSRLFDIVSIPVIVNDEVAGVLTFGVELRESDVKELSQLTGTGIVLFADGVVSISSLARPDIVDMCAQILRRSGNQTTSSMFQLELPHEHFLATTGRFRTSAAGQNLQYVLLYPFDAALADLHVTQRTIVSAGLAGILISMIIAWIVIRGITRPLQELRDTVETVGRGDLTRRARVVSRDECGQLSEGFNRMMDRLQAARAKQEETLETLRTTQQQLIQREKLSAIGEFIAGVTHELNNPLTSLLGFAELLQQTETTAQQRRFVDRVAVSAQRCQKIVQSLLSFARQHQPERKLTNLNQVIEAVLEIMAYDMRTSNIEVTKRLDPALPSVMADPHQMQQVFLNIVNNGRQAMEAHRSRGQLLITSESTATHVRFTFKDDGPGIAPDNVSKIFDPFFTTKEAGKGTGLGLSLSYGIVNEHGGSIAVKSTVGHGAAFIIELPLQSIFPATQEESPVAVASFNPAGKSVLVVDDEEAILDLATEVLKGAGYKVDTANNGQAALDRLRRRNYDLTLCDLKMPGMTGFELYLQIVKEDPEAAKRFIFMTGDVVSEKTQAFLKEQDKACLPKPFSVAEFCQTVGQRTSVP